MPAESFSHSLQCRHDVIVSTLAPMADFIAPAPISPSRLAQRRRLSVTDGSSGASQLNCSPPSLAAADLKDDPNQYHDDNWMCSQPRTDEPSAFDILSTSVSSEGGDCEEVNEAAGDEQADDDDEQAEVERRRQRFSLEFDDMPILDAEDEWERDDSLAALTSHSLDTAALFSNTPSSSQSPSTPSVTSTSLDTAPQQQSMVDVVDLTSDDDEDEPLQFRSAPTRSVSALSSFASPLSASSHSTTTSPITVPRPSVRRNITDFFVQSAGKQWAVKEEVADTKHGVKHEPLLSSLSARSAAASSVKQEAAENNWQYLLTGRQTVKQEKPAGRGGRGRGAAGRGRGKQTAADSSTTAANGFGRGRGKRYDRFAGSYAKAEQPSIVKAERPFDVYSDEAITDELDPSTFTSPSLFVKSENDEARTLEHIRRYTLAHWLPVGAHAHRSSGWRALTS